MVHATGEVYVNDARAPAEVTIFSGDTVYTAGGGSAGLEVPGKGTLTLGPETRVAFGGTKGYFATLKLGTLRVRWLAGARDFDFQIDHHVVVSDPTTEAAGEVT